MIVNNLSEIINNDFYVIIIGSGPAGISTALELEKNNIKSLILEAGGKETDFNSSLFLKGEVVGDEYPDLSSTRLRQFGGTSGHWGGNCNPMIKEDLDSWPISLSDLEEYSSQAMKILNLREDFFNEKFSKNLNLYNLVWSNVRFGKKYFQHIQKSKYIFLSLNTTFLNFNGQDKKINSITCFKNNNFYQLKSKFYILCCGGIENSRLMLWSKEKNKSLFNDNLPIGKYYMNHPAYSIGEGVMVHEKYVSYFSKNTIKNKPLITCKNEIYFSANKEFLTKNNILNSGIYLNFKVAWKYNSIFKQLRCVAPKYFKNIYENLKAQKVYEINIETIQEQKPDKDNYINLSSDFDPLNLPLSKIFWKRSLSEIKSVRLIAEELGKIFVDEDIGRIALNKYLYNDSEEYGYSAGNHQLGGTRIGSYENDSVVDKNLKVHNIENLFVNGSSVFRTGGHCHPTYTIVKLSLRLANYLKNYRI